MTARFKDNKFWTGIPPWVLLGAVAVLLPIFAFMTVQNIHREKEFTTRLLLEKGADVSAAGADGNTALHIAAFLAHEELVELLLDKGAPVRAKNGRGETPLDVVSADWSPQLEQTYRTIGELVGIELDLARIKPERPKVAELLSKHAVR